MGGNVQEIRQIRRGVVVDVLECVQEDFKLNLNMTGSQCRTGGER